MALSDPELDLLMELLVDDPGADVWLQVGEELVRRGEWSDAERVISAGQAEEPDAAGWPLLARARLELGRPEQALQALQNVPFDPGARETALLYVLTLERSGRREEALDRVESVLALHPDDVVGGAARERLQAPVSPVPSSNRLMPDPLVSVERAHRYVAVGRPDRAARVYRRILYHHPDHAEATRGLRQLGDGSAGRMLTEDLSEELVDPAMAPPTLDMPAPQLATLIADEEATEPHALTEAIEAYIRGDGAHPLPSTFEDEVTDPLASLSEEEIDALVTDTSRRRRRRRSLLNR